MKVYQVDSFADQRFKGNPAAVCITEDWMSEKLMQQIANENNLSETAFVVPNGSDYSIRWFTPEVEVDLCGHATLASAFIIFKFIDQDADQLRFHSKNSGLLTVRKEGEKLLMDFPADVMEPADNIREIAESFHITPREVWRGKTDYMAVFENQAEIESMSPDKGKLSQIKSRGVIVTAPGNDTDFVSRFFAPQSGIYEDPVTGSAHTTLTPYWAKRLGKTSLTARQLSERSGYLECCLLGDRVEISGKAVLYLTGDIFLD